MERAVRAAAVLSEHEELETYGSKSENAESDTNSKKAEYGRRLLLNKFALIACLALIALVLATIVLSSLASVSDEVDHMAGDVESEYDSLIDRYTVSFNAILIPVKEKLAENPSFDEMNAWLQSMEGVFSSAFGSEYDGFALTYQGGYAHSWNYGDYSQYDPTTRPWYQAAEAADGDVAVVAPYITYLDASYAEDGSLVNNNYMLMTIAQKYNDEVFFDYDIKTEGIRNLLAGRTFDYDNATALVYDTDGYILSSSNENLYSHNVYQVDEVIRDGLQDELMRAADSSGALFCMANDGEPGFLYSRGDGHGHTFCLFIPLWSIVTRHFFVAVLFLLALAALSLFLYWALRSRLNKDTQRLTNALAQAEVATQAKTDFLSRMSHEIRTPMNAIMGMTRLAADVPNNPDDTAYYLKEIDGSSEYLLGLLNDILDMSRIESGKFELNPAWVNMNDLFRSCVDMMRPQLEEKGVRFIYPHINRVKGLEVYVDAMRTKQVMVNLLSNACKFTPKGGTVTLALRHLSTEGDWSTDAIVVSDTGCGMSSGFVESVFEPFEQERNPFSDEVKGTGLGLPLVKQIVDAMGGTVSVKSELGCGSVFTVVCPHRFRAVQNVKSHETAEHLAVLQGSHVLLVDDHPANRMIARRLLEKHGVIVDEAEDGEEAVASFSASAESFYDAVLMDMNMPKMGGIEATRAMRSLVRADALDVPIIAMTANAFTEDTRRTHEAGMNAHLAKPVRPDVLYRTLVDQMEARGSLAASARSVAQGMVATVATAATAAPSVAAQDAACAVPATAWDSDDMADAASDVS